ncbi:MULTISPECIES: TetR/AcrR family transcriptional regulator [unclassified Salinibacterium]|uniref:TetR/AcrR family transcriptional regulator n=1 Tax=unclassified Salinibacterium TaxID=2632331 RepID=UPI0018CF0727|nr:MULTISPECIES: TetR family transcriptional regulator C-terminal domain-containing protein [unclassified Salinibacterium]MBH0053192.1 TetR/AcrR family transcriptional regulator [Salinibacterium sp. SWN139]MBH0082452.1 TetR/AcrR family transcriptional regulator [Salinibacterium sp. SWN167]
MAAGTTRRRNPAERALEVREAAKTLALTRGLAAISLRNLATHCGVTAPLIAHYEPNMDALVASTFAAIAEQEIAEVSLHALAPDDTLDQLRALISALADPARDNVGEVWCDAWSLGRKNEPLAEAARHSMDSWHALAIGIIRTGQNGGRFAAIAPERAALVLFALVDATASYQLVNFRSRETRDALVRETLEDMLDVSLRINEDARNPSNKPTV